MGRASAVRSPPSRMVIGYATAGATLVAVALQQAVPIDDLTRDVNAVAHVPWYVGAVSNIGILVWMSGAAIALFVGIATRQPGFDPGRARLLWTSGAASAWLALDDLLQLHEDVLPTLSGTSEKFVMLAYLVLAIAWLGTNHRALRDAGLAALAFAGTCFAISVVLDIVPTDAIPGLWHLQTGLVEDGAKFLGIVGWALWLARVAARQLAALAPRTAH